MSEVSYPYHATDGTCVYNASNSYTAINTVSHTAVTSGSTSALQAAIAGQVVTVTIEADKLCFQFYSSGVLDNTACGTTLDHAVAAVGYGNENNLNYYLVRNSWGSSWGDQGYIKIAAVEGDGICGIQMNSLFPNLK